jgi:hypothetical protein
LRLNLGQARVVDAQVDQLGSALADVWAGFVRKCVVPDRKLVGAELWVVAH